jgi:hypothetical protein
MKTIIIAIMILSCSAAYAIPVRLTLSGEIELGSDIASYNAFADVNAAFNLYFWKCKNSLYGGSTTWMQMDWNEPSGNPYREIYYIGNRFSIYGFFVDVRHFCNHPVFTQIHYNRYGYENQKWQSNFWGETITTIAVGYEFEYEIWHN